MNAQDSIAHACELLKQGKVVAIPTETVYGLAADALNPLAVQQIFSLKQRPSNHPLIVHIEHSDHLKNWAMNIPDYVWTLAKTFWPGPLTLILEKHPDVPLQITGGQNTIGLRVPNHSLTLALLKQFQGALVAPSANRFGHISPTSPEHVKHSLNNQVALILDGGHCAIGLESTIVYCPSNPQNLRILRKGYHQKKDLLDTLGLPCDNAIPCKQTIPMVRTAGQSASHYAPNKPLLIVPPTELSKAVQQRLDHKQTLAVLSFSHKPQRWSTLETKILHWVTSAQSPALYAKSLYQYLYDFERFADTILLEAVPPTEQWEAIADRLKRASA